MEPQKKYIRYVNKQQQNIYTGGFGDDNSIYYKRPPMPQFDYGGDFAIAKLYVNAKNEGSFPICTIKGDKNIFSYDNLKKLRHYTKVANNAFIDLYSLLNSPDYKDAKGGLTDEDKQIQKISHGEKLILVIYMRIFTFFDNAIKSGIEFISEQRFNDTKEYLFDMIKSNEFNITNLCEILKLLCIVSGNDDGSGTDASQSVYEYVSSYLFNKEENVKLIYDKAIDKGIYSAVVSKNQFMQANIKKHTVCIFTRTGAYGINTFLFLVFNNLIPLATSLLVHCTNEEVCVHAETQKGVFSMLMHDINHAFRTINVINDKLVHLYFKLCYIIIINELAGSDLLLYLFILINELSFYSKIIGTYYENPISVKNFDTMYKLFFSFRNSYKYSIRVEHDVLFLQLVQAFNCANAKQYFSKRDVFESNNRNDGIENDKYLFSCLDNLHKKFNDSFYIINAFTIDDSIYNEYNTNWSNYDITQKNEAIQNIKNKLRKPLIDAIKKIYNDYNPENIISKYPNAIKEESYANQVSQWKDMKQLIDTDIMSKIEGADIFYKELPPVINATYFYLSIDNKKELESLNIKNIELPGWIKYEILMEAKFGKESVNVLRDIEKKFGFFVWGSCFANTTTFLPYKEYPIVYNGMQYNSSEHAFHAAKSIGTSDEQTVKNIINNYKSQDVGNNVGRKYGLRSDWNQVKNDIMFSILKIKFKDSELLNILKSTNNHTIVNPNIFDNYWGTDKGFGENVLGKLLMQIRNQL